MADWWWKVGLKWIGIGCGTASLLVWQDSYFRDEEGVHAITRHIASNIVPESVYREERIAAVNQTAELAERRMEMMRRWRDSISLKDRLTKPDDPLIKPHYEYSKSAE